ncbi:hypothetical protein [Moorena producens]|nr:hypothetical protein [Moorena producens]
MQSASGGNHGSRSWGEPPVPLLHRFLPTLQAKSPHFPTCKKNPN